MRLKSSDFEDSEIVKRYVLMAATAAAESIDQTIGQLLALRTRRQRRALGSALCVFRWQMIKLGVMLEDGDIASALGIPLTLMRSILPSRQEQARALRASGYSLAQASKLMRLRPGTVNRLASADVPSER